MNLHPTPSTAPSSATRTHRRRRHRGGGLLRLLLAIGLALLVLLPTAHWVLEWRMVEYLLPWLLTPSTGFFSLTLALWLLFTVPGVLRRRSGEPTGSGASSEGTTTGADDPAAKRDRGPEGVAEEGGLRIPTGTFHEFGTEHRWEMAQALGIPWRDELIHDQQSWAIACLEAAQRKAAELR